MNCWRRNSRCSVRSSDAESWERLCLVSKERLLALEGCWLLPSKEGPLGVWMFERCPRVETGVRRRIRNSVLKIETQLVLDFNPIILTGICWVYIYSF